MDYSPSGFHNSRPKMVQSPALTSGVRVPFGFQEKRGSILPNYPVSINEVRLYSTNVEAAAEICRQIDDCDGLTMTRSGEFEIRRGPLTAENPTVIGEDAGHISLVLDRARYYKETRDIILAKTANTSLSGNETCYPMNLVGSISNFISLGTDDARWEHFSRTMESVMNESSFSPPGCSVNDETNIAIIVPFRDNDTLVRTRQFYSLLSSLIPMLIRQNVRFGFYLVNQGGPNDVPFNRGKLMNVGFQTAAADGFECFFFHDVDLIPENDKNLYRCTSNPKHYSGWIDKWNYIMPYEGLFGGITAFSKAAFEKVNGYSNEFWGWGAEDDDLSLRTFNERTGFKMVRPAEEVTRFKMIKHEHEANNAANSHRFALVRNGRKFWGRDGLNSLDYEVLTLDRDIFFTNVTVDLHYDSRKTKQWGIERRAINKRSEPNEFFWTFMSSNSNVF